MDISEELRQAEETCHKWGEALRAVPALLSQLDNDGKDFFQMIGQALCESSYLDGFEDGRKDRGESEDGQPTGDRTWVIGHLTSPNTYWGWCEPCDGPKYLGWCQGRENAFPYGLATRKASTLPPNGCWIVAD